MNIKILRKIMDECHNSCKVEHTTFAITIRKYNGFDKDYDVKIFDDCYLIIRCIKYDAYGKTDSVLEYSSLSGRWL